MTETNIPLHERRSFLAKLFAIVGGGIALLVPTAVGLASFLNPLRQKGQSGDFKLTTLETLPEDGTPMRFPIIVQERIDAWSHYPHESIGAVYLRRLKSNDGKPRVQAMQVICPHAGCSIAYEPGEKGGKFYCPCHGANFDLAGARTDQKSESPRDMDALEAEIRNGNEVWVKYQAFVVGIAEKKTEA
jgi:menaquinol-cytochrome c reductase iron-sulfur subunit